MRNTLPGICIVIGSLLAMPLAQAFQISNTSLFLPAQEEQTELVLNNTQSRAVFVAIQVNELSSPTAQGKIVQHKSQDIVLSQKKFIISANTQKKVTFKYQGPIDNRERYYRLVWHRESLQHKKTESEMIHPMIIETLLVVNPRKDKFEYTYRNGTLINKGNSSFRAVASGSCRAGSAQKWCTQYAYLMPGWQSNFDQIKLDHSSSTITIKYGKEFVTVI
ncbi:MAG: fimbria/pilus periplasmic chaperone [Enterobacteriaceae bacterium]